MIEQITRTFDLLEDLARAGVVRVTINKPPKEHATCTLPGIFALIPHKPHKQGQTDSFWRVFNHNKHGGMSCGNGLGLTPDKKWYWAQAQCKPIFFTGEYVWIGQATKAYRKWESEEVINALLT